MKFTVDKQVFVLLPEAYFGVVIAQGIDNAGSYAEIQERLENAIKDAEARYGDVKVKETAEIRPYREAFEKLGINPNKFMSSIEALLTRISKKKGFPSINPIVDLGNAISLKYSLPIGAHDIDTLDGDLSVRLSTDEDSFIPFGETEAEYPGSGELVYATGNKIRTRRWIWRQSEQGKITENTANVLFPIDGFLGSKDEVLAARDELAKLLETVFSCEVSVGYVDAGNREFSV